MGLGSALLQNTQPVMYVSRWLTKTEECYAKIEKESLGIVFGLTKFDQYTYGRSVAVNMDHKPLEIIARQLFRDAPKQFHGMLLALQQFDLLPW